MSRSHRRRHGIRPLPFTAVMRAIALGLTGVVLTTGIVHAAARKPKRPDLVVASLAVAPTSTGAGATIQVTGSIANRGTAKAAVSSTLIVLSRNRKRDAADVAIAPAVRTAAVAPRKKAPLSAKVTVPSGTAPGAWFVVACVNPAGAVREANKTNNCRSAPLTIAAAAAPTTKGPAPSADGGSSGGGGGGGGGDDLPPPPPPGPREEPPSELPAGEATAVADAMRFLWDASGGKVPTQKDVAAGAIEDAFVFVLRGRVLHWVTVAGVPELQGMSGVRVAVSGAPEFGYTLTESNGTFAFALNGGGDVVLSVTKDGHIPVQRTVSSGWNDFGVVEDIVLTPLDDPMTDPAGDGLVLGASAAAVDDPAAIQVLQGPEETDADGSRRTTLMFKPGTDATAVPEKGAPTPLTGSLGVRATEFTVGDGGDIAMPGSLPPTTGYTYAVEYSIDEAGGARSVEFDKAVISYTDNFIDAPVGSSVPTGWYDRVDNAWKAGKDGLVVRIYEVTGGVASLDIDSEVGGDVGPETTAELATAFGDGITEAEVVAELTRLAGLHPTSPKGTVATIEDLPVTGAVNDGYIVSADGDLYVWDGDSWNNVGEGRFEFWRVKIDHFTPWDFNWPYGPPIEPRRPRLPPLNPFIEDPKYVRKDPCAQAGSIVECETRVLGEEIPIVGTPYRLTYRSDRVAGYTANRNVVIPITDGTALDPNLKGIELKVEVAGTETTRRWCRHLVGGQPAPERDCPAAMSWFDPEPPNSPEALSYEFTWDGKDAWGRDVFGSIDATVTLTYIYDLKYYTTQSDYQSSFSAVPDGSAAQAFEARSACGNDTGSAESTFFCGYPLAVTRALPMGLWETKQQTNLGGWGISAHHAYDPAAETLYRGDMKTQTSRDMSSILQDVAGLTFSGNYPTYREDLGDDEQLRAAKTASLSPVEDIALAPDGSIVIASKPCNSSIAGYVGGIRRVLADGTVEQLAGGSPYYTTCVDGNVTGRDGLDTDGLAKYARLGAHINGIDVGPDGSIYFSEAPDLETDTYGVIRKLEFGAGGTSVTTIAGSRTAITTCNAPAGRMTCGDEGALATAAAINPRAIAVAPDGSVYFVDGTGSGPSRERIRVISPDGRVRTVAGGGISPVAQPDLSASGEVALDADLGNAHDVGSGIRDIALAPDGSLVIAVARDIDSDTYVDNLIERVTPDGRILRIAGRRFVPGAQAIDNFGIDYAKARTQTSIGEPAGVAVGPRGDVYVKTLVHDRAFGAYDVVQIADDALRRVAGARGSCPADVDLQPAQDVCLSRIGYTRNGWRPDSGIAVRPDGGILIVDGERTGSSAAQVIRLLTPVLPGFADDDVLIPSPDGSEAYRLSATGRHLETLDGLTGRTTLTFGYDSAGRLTTLEDEFHNVTTITRAADGTPAAIRAPGQQETKLAIGPDGYLSSITSPAGRMTSLAYGTGGRLTGLTEPGGDAHTFLYDTNGLLVKDSGPDGQEVTLTSSTPAADTYRVDATRRIRPGDGAGATEVTRYEVTRLDDGSQQRTVKTPSGATTSVIMQPDGTEVRTDPDGTVTTTTVAPDPRWGGRVLYTAKTTVRLPKPLPSSETRPTRTVTTVRTATLAIAGNPFSAPSVVEKTWHDATTSDFDLHSTQTWTADTDLDPESVTPTITRISPAVSGGPAGRTSRTTLNEHGQVVAYLADSAKDGADEPVLLETTFAYNPDGTLKERAQGDMKRTFTYDVGKRLTGVTDAAGRKWSYTYDADGLELTRTIPDGAATVTGDTTYTTTYAGDAPTPTGFGRSPAEAHAFTATAGGTMASHTPPSGTATTWAYDAASRRTRLTHASGAWEQRTYANGRLTRTTFSDGGSIERAAYEAYEGGGTDKPTVLARSAGVPLWNTVLTYNGPTVTGIAQANPDGTGNGAGSGEVTLDATSRAIAFAVTIDGNTFTQALGGRDPDGLATSIGDFSITRAGPAGALTEMADSKARLTRTYDEIGRFASSTLTTVRGTPIYSTALTYSTTGAVATRSETVRAAPQTTQTFTRDDAGRITEVAGASPGTWSWDAGGNRLTRSTTTSSYTFGDRVTAIAGSPAHVDEDGYLEREGPDAPAEPTRTYVYSPAGELTSATVGAAAVAYRYDAYGRRVQRTDAAGTTTYVYANPDDFLRITASRFKPTAGLEEVSIYTYDGDGRLLAIDRGPTLTAEALTRYYVGSDHLGSPRIVVSVGEDGAPTTAWQADYAVDGTETVVKGTGSDDDPYFHMPIGFAGGLRDWTTGFVRFGARDYDPRTARFTTPDPTLFQGSPLNLYDYANGDPVSNGDPSGLSCMGAGFGAIAYFGSSFCEDKEGKASLCLEFGVGAGMGLDYDKNGAVADDVLTVNAEVSAKMGIAAVVVGAEVNMDCDTVKASGKANGGPVTLFAVDENGLRFAGPNSVTDIAQGSVGGPIQKDWQEYLEGKWGFEGKLTGKWCWNNKG